MAVARARRIVPSAQPAMRLRRVLAVRRRSRLAWSDEEFDSIVDRLTATLEEHDREGWRLILREQREAWRSAYERQPVMLLRLAGLLD